MYDSEAAQTDLSRVELFRIYRGKVSNNPLVASDDMFVTIPQLDDEDDPRGYHNHGPVLGWDRRYDGSLPSAGDSVTVFVDDTGDYWCVNWTPYD
jgi:hypothetical protein